ncbi:MAG TPA: 2-octaprenyl-6-methoxyphenyl hydroxylase, partial [Alcanivorax sp.]|nr:2-octaprenyl-6-methoxyphenyl hydroxylase [Alcanivorax sp.]
MSKPIFSGDVVISGGGLAGLTLALALHKAGLAVAVIDAMALSEHVTPEHDGRASA